MKLYKKPTTFHEYMEFPCRKKVTVPSIMLSKNQLITIDVQNQAKPYGMLLMFVLTSSLTQNLSLTLITSCCKSRWSNMYKVSINWIFTFSLVSYQIFK